MSAGFPAKIAMAIQLGGSGDLKETVAWKYSKGTAYVPSPILYGDYLYLTTIAGFSLVSTQKRAKLCTKAAGFRFRLLSPRRQSRLMGRF